MERQLFLIFGASGKTGEAIVKELINRDNRVVICVRNKEKAENLFYDIKDKLDIIELKNFIDINNLKDLIKRINPDYVISSLGFNSDDFNTFYNDQFFANALIIKSSMENGIKNFIFISTLFLERPTIYMSKFIENRRPNALFYKSLIEILIKRSGMRYIIIRPGKLEDIGDGPVDTNIGQGDKVLWTTTHKTVAFILAEVLKLNNLNKCTLEIAGLPYMLNNSFDRDKLSRLNELKNDKEEYIIRNYNGSARYFYGHNTALKFMTLGCVFKLVGYIIKRRFRV